MAQVGNRVPLGNKTNQLKGQVLASKQDVKKAPIKDLQTNTKKRPLESDKENENVQPMTKKQKVIGETIAAILKAPPTKKKPTIADPENFIKHLQEVATKSQEEIANIKQKSKDEAELSELHLQLASLRNQLTIARRNNQDGIDYKAKYEAKKAQCRQLKNNLEELSILYDTVTFELNELKKQDQKANQKDQIKKNILAQLKLDKLREEGSIVEDEDGEDEYSSQDDELVVQN
eukprot:TRINITY_DN12888_c0_g1_i1.p1 TRINITY_DN12888_c0_g1~~TRINITY_DN12888_c0_g1_i1.p1  ORF type:complete len:233 (-),score=82.36 TRINITY_DN12888_c0_g1_i1:61-759(-)